MTLQEVWKVIPPEEYAYVGEASGFFFIGNKAEFFEVIPAEYLIKEVVEIYPRLSGGYGVVVEGSKVGRLWSREEWKGWYKQYAHEGCNFDIFFAGIGRRRWRDE